MSLSLPRSILGKSVSLPGTYKGREAMTKLLATCCLAMVAGFSVPVFAQEKPALRLVQTLPLPGVKAHRPAPTNCTAFHERGNSAQRLRRQSAGGLLKTNMD